MTRKMRKMIDLAVGRKKAQFVLKNCKIVNVFSHEIVKSDIAIDSGKIVGIGDYDGIREMDLDGKYVAPGLIDSHVHIESSMVTPNQFARAIVPRGTTTIIADPHEIGNVCGLKGIRYMIEASKQLPLNVFFMLPSCVPATPFESSGAVLEADQLKKFIDHPKVLGLGELMDYPSVIEGKENILEKINLAKGKIIDGHGPELSEKELNAYIISGVNTDHECSTVEEMIDRIRLGGYISIREGSAARNLDALIKGVTRENMRRCTFCTDDRHPSDIYRYGHIDNNIKMAIKRGIDPISAIKIATINTAECYGLDHIGAIAPGYDADLILLDDLESFTVLKVFKKGELVAENKKPLFHIESSDYSKIINTVNVKKIMKEDLMIKIDSNFANVIKILPHSLVTEKEIREVKIDENGILQYEKDSDLSKIAVVERHRATGNIGLGLVDNFGLKGGAITSTIAHDSHNLIVIGDNDEDMFLGMEEIIRVGGGICITSQGEILKTLKLPLGGIMSDQSMERVHEILDEMLQIAYEKLRVNREIDPFITLAFLALPVIPEIKITDKGIFDVKEMKFINIGVEK